MIDYVDTFFICIYMYTCEWAIGVDFTVGRRHTRQTIFSHNIIFVYIQLKDSRLEVKLKLKKNKNVYMYKYLYFSSMDIQHICIIKVGIYIYIYTCVYICI